jgi:hypothetical protein
MVDSAAVGTEWRNRKEQVVQMTRQQFRSGFICSGLLLVLIAFTVIISVLAKPANQPASDGKQSATPNQVSGTAHAVTEMSRSVRALTRLM